MITPDPYSPQPDQIAMLQLTTKCPFCQKKQTITVSESGYNKWRRGALIQHALPNLTPDEREALMTGICSDCFPS